MNFRPYRDRKPPFGTSINRNHPFWRYADVYLPFNEGSGATPMEYVRGVPVQPIGTTAPTWVPGALGGSAPHLATTTNWAIPGAGDYTTQPFSCSFWIKQDSTANATDVFATGKYNSTGWQISLNESGGSAIPGNIYISLGTNRFYSASGPGVPGVWQHWVVSRNVIQGGANSIYYCYVNGEFFYDYGNPAAITVGGPLEINSLYWTAARSFAIDNVLFLNGYALSGAQAGALYADPWQLFAPRPAMVAVPAIVPTLSVTGTVYANNTAQTVAIVGFDRDWTIGSESTFSIGGTPPAGVSIAAQSTTSTQAGSVTFATGTTAGTVTLTDGTASVSVPIVAPSFSIAPTTIPANHAGPITLTLTGSGTGWSSGVTTATTTGSVPTGAAIVGGSLTVIGTTEATIQVATGSGAGSLTLVVDGLQATTTIATATLSATTSRSLLATGVYTVSFVGDNTVWTRETAATLFRVNSWPGASISNIVVGDDGHATATLALGTTTLAAGPISLLDASTGNSVSIAVATLPSGSLHATAAAVLSHTDTGTLILGDQAEAWLWFRFTMASSPAVPNAPVTLIGWTTGSAMATLYPTSNQLSLSLHAATGANVSTTIAVQYGVGYDILYVAGGGTYSIYVNGVSQAIATNSSATYGYSGLQIGPSQGGSNQLDLQMSSVAVGSGYAPTASDALNLSNGTVTPIGLGTPASAWWELGGGTIGDEPSLDDDAFNDLTGNGNALTLSSGSFTYAAPIVRSDPFLRSDLITRSGKLAFFGITSSHQVPDAGYPIAAITAVNGTPTVYRDAIAVAIGPATWLSSSHDLAGVGFLLQCGSVEQLGIIDGGAGYVDPVVTWDGTGGGSHLVLGTPVLRTGVTGYAVGSNGNYYGSVPTVTIATPTGYNVGVTSPMAAFGTATLTGMGVGAIEPTVGGMTGGCGAQYVVESPPAVTLFGGSGSGAVFTTTLAAGSIASIAVSAGSGYPAGATIPLTIADANGTGATATVTIGSTGVPSVVTVTAIGSDYTAPVVTIPFVAATATATVSTYIAYVPIISSSNDFTSLPGFTIADGGGTPSRAASFLPIMSGVNAGDVVTYDAPASWIAPTIGGYAMGGMGAVTGQAMVNSTGAPEAAAGGLSTFARPVTILAGANLAEQPIGAQNAINPMRNKAASVPWTVPGSQDWITFDPLGSGRPVSWINPTLTTLWKTFYATAQVNQLDGMGGPNLTGQWSAVYTDPNLNTAQATWVQLWSGVNTIWTYISQSGPYAGQGQGAVVNSADITVTNGQITGVGTASSSLGTGYQGAFVLVTVTSGSGSGAAITARILDGEITTFDVVLPGSNYTAGDVVITVYGTAVTGNVVTHIVEFAAITTPISWNIQGHLSVAHVDGVWHIGSPAVTPPDVATGLAQPFDPTQPLQPDANVIAALTTTNGRTPASLRFMDGILNYAGMSNLVYPTDLFDPTWDNWVNGAFTGIAVFQSLRFFNTDPSSPVFDWSSTRIYGPQAFFAATETPFTVTGTLTAGSIVVANVSGAALMCGSIITGTGIPSGPDGEPNRITRLVDSTDIWIAYPATASGSQSLSVTNTYCQLPATDFGSFLTNRGGAVMELVSTSPHGLTTGQTAKIPYGGGPQIPFQSGPSNSGGVTSCLWVTGPYSILVRNGFAGGPTTGAPTVVQSTLPIDLTVGGTTAGWQVDLYTPTTSSTSGTMPIEVAAAIVSALPGCDIWFNISSCCTRELIMEMARRLARTLGSTNGVRLEYANELWNGVTTRTEVGFGIGGLIGYTAAGTVAYNDYVSTGARMPMSGSYSGASALIGDDLYNDFLSAWVSAGRDANQVTWTHGSWFGVGSQVAPWALEALGRAAKTPRALNVAPYMDCPSDEPFMAAFAPAGSVAYGDNSGSWPVDAIIDLYRHWMAYSLVNQGCWSSHALSCQAYGQPSRSRIVSIASNATATAVLTPTTIAGITATLAGINYSSSTTATIYGGGWANVTIGVTVSGGAITGFDTSAIPSDARWTSVPLVSINDPTGAGSLGFATVTLTATSVASCSIVWGGLGYGQSGASTVTATIGAPQTSGTTATAGTVTLSGGSVTSVPIAVNGSGYTATPLVTIAGGGILAAATYSLKYTFVDAGGNETTTGGTSEITTFTLPSGASPVLIETPALPTWAVSSNIYLTSGQPGSETLYASVTQAQAVSTGYWLPIEAYRVSGQAATPSLTAPPPPTANQVPSGTIGPLPVLVTYEGGLEAPIPHTAVLAPQVNHDIAAHPAMRYAITGWNAICQVGNQATPNSGAILTNYYQAFTQPNYMGGDGLWDLSPAIHIFGGVGASNRFATVQGGGTAANPPDGHDHWGGPSGNVSPALQGLLDVIATTSMVPVQPKTAIPRKHRWFSGLGQAARPTR